MDSVRFLIKVANSDKNGCNKALKTCPHTLCWAPSSVYHFEHRLLIISNVRGLLGQTPSGYQGDSGDW